MKYKMNIISTESVETIIRTDKNEHISLTLAVGQIYKVGSFQNTKHARRNMGRKIEILGFTDDWAPDGAIVRYLDTNRRGRVPINNILPLDSD